MEPEPSADIISIAELRADAVRVTSGFSIVSLLPMSVGIHIARNYAGLPGSLSLVAVTALVIGCLFLATQQARNYTSGMLKSVMWLAGILGGLTIPLCVGLAVAAVLSVVSEGDIWTAPLVGAFLLFMLLGAFLFLFKPWISARRLLHTRLRPNGVPFTAVMEPLAPHQMFTPWTFGQSS